MDKEDRKLYEGIKNLEEGINRITKERDEWKKKYGELISEASILRDKPLEFALNLFKNYEGENVIFIDSKNKISMMTKSAKNILGYGAENYSLIGQQYEESIMADEKNAKLFSVYLTLANNGIKQEEKVFRYKKKNEKDISIFTEFECLYGGFSTLAIMGRKAGFRDDKEEKGLLLEYNVIEEEFISEINEKKETEEDIFVDLKNKQMQNGLMEVVVELADKRRDSFFILNACDKDKDILLRKRVNDSQLLYFSKQNNS